MIDAEQGERYEGFGIRELICDPFFQDWILRPDRDSDAFWTNWTRTHPDREALIAEAATLLRSIGFTEDFPPEERVERSMARAMAAIQPRRTAWRVAAVLVGAALCTGLYWYFHKKPVTESTTQYGEMRTLYLPDSSKVILNAHSSLHYAWVPGGTREIWLEGEAYFDVRPVKNSVFLVHAGKLSVEVLGTRFDIRDRRGKVVVVLEEGKIRVRYLDSALVLTPGEEVLLDTAKVAVTKAPDNYTTWKEKRLTDVTVADIAEYLEDNYHKKVILQDPAMARRRIGGVVLLDNLDDALFALSTVLNAEIIQSGDTLVVRPK